MHLLHLLAQAYEIQKQHSNIPTNNIPFQMHDKTTIYLASSLNYEETSS
jgi:hypothetical protein